MKEQRLIDANELLRIIDAAYPNLDRQDIKQWIVSAPTIEVRMAENAENNSSVR